MTHSISCRHGAFAVAALAVLVWTAGAPALAEPASSDQLMIWRLYQAGPDSSTERHNLTYYFVKQHWLTDELGVYGFYTPAGAGVMRAMWHFKPAGKLGATLMAGGRFTGLTSSLKTFPAGYHEGPEAALVLGHPLPGGFGISTLASYAHLFDMSAAPASREQKGLIYYGLNLKSPSWHGTSVTLGLLGAILTAYPSGLAFHDVGPTLAFSHEY